MFLNRLLGQVDLFTVKGALIKISDLLLEVNLLRKSFSTL